MLGETVRCAARHLAPRRCRHRPRHPPVCAEPLARARRRVVPACRGRPPADPGFPADDAVGGIRPAAGRAHGRQPALQCAALHQAGRNAFSSPRAGAPAKVLVEVRDNGPGIAAEHQEAIFAEFYQVGNTARETDRGLGLGLSIVNRLARALGVEVRLRSAPGRGTTFGLLIEAARPLVAASPQRSPQDVPAIHFVGAGDDLRAAMELARNWDYAISHHPRATGMLPAVRGPSGRRHAGEPRRRGSCHRPAGNARHRARRHPLATARRKVLTPCRCRCVRPGCAHCSTSFRRTLAKSTG